MIPHGAQGAGHLATRIAMDLIPKATDAYVISDLGMIAGLIGLVAQDYDRAAEVLTSDLERLRGLFAQAEPLIADPDLKARLAAARELRPVSLRISALSADADLALKVLIDLHAAVENAVDAGEPWAPGLDREIWTYLDEYVAKRTYNAAF